MNASQIYETWLSGNLSDAKEGLANHPDPAGAMATLFVGLDPPLEMGRYMQFCVWVLHTAEEGQL